MSSHNISQTDQMSKEHCVFYRRLTSGVLSSPRLTGLNGVSSSSESL
jgi:hypothetical protein